MAAVRMRIVLAAGMGGLLISASGCMFVAGAAAAGAVYAYAHGEGRVMYARTLEKTHEAVLAALRDDLGFTIVSNRLETRGSRIRAARDGPDITARLTREGERLTKVQVRVGLFGREMLTRQIFDRIDARLGIRDNRAAPRPDG